MIKIGSSETKPAAMVTSAGVEKIILRNFNHSLGRGACTLALYIVVWASAAGFLRYRGIPGKEPEGILFNIGGVDDMG